jgi:two-component system, OmpR family, response regulator ResD
MVNALHSEGHIRTLGTLELDPKTLVAKHLGHRVHLTRREFQLLAYFLAHPNETFTASSLAEWAWGAPLSNEQVRMHVARLRVRLSDLNLPCRLESRTRRGYRFVCDR